MLPRCSSRDNIPYEALLDNQEQRQQERFRVCSIAALLWACSALVVFAVGHFTGTASLSQAPAASTRKDEHSIPTPLSVRDPGTGQFVNALDNPLYDKLKQALLLRKNTASLRRGLWTEAPKLSLDRVETTIRQPLTISWTLGKAVNGSPVVTNDDVLSLHCPHYSASFQEAATLAQVHATTGRPLENSWFLSDFPILRQETCQFRLYSPDDEWLAESPILHIRDSPKTPTGVHLAFTNDTTQMVVQFTTGESGTPVATYGINLTSTKVEGTSHTYDATDMCQEPANVTETGKFQPPGMLHVVTLEDLEPDTDYQYKVGLAGGQGIVWSDTFTFHSAPAVGDTGQFSYVVYGDQGCPSVGWGEGGTWTAAMASRESSIRAVHHFGDLSYARGAAHIWDEWFHMIEPFTSQVPLMIAVGNHEYDHTTGGGDGKDPSGLNSSHGFMPVWGNFGDDSGGECGVPTSNRFVMPASVGSNGVFWYSHDYASVHTTVISSEHNLTKGSDQYEWLEADLGAVNRTLTPWLVVEFHRPMYESESFWDQTAVGVAMRHEFEDLLYEYKVDLVLNGHYHSYQRTCDGLYRSQCFSGGPLHITVGSAGAALTTYPLYPQHWTDRSIQGEYGYGRITVANASALYWEFVRAGAENDTDAGSVHDAVWIIRDR